MRSESVLLALGEPGHTGDGGHGKRHIQYHAGVTGARRCSAADGKGEGAGTAIVEPDQTGMEALRELGGKRSLQAERIAADNVVLGVEGTPSTQTEVTWLAAPRLMPNCTSAPA